jgi:cytochrome c peroxidase
MKRFATLYLTVALAIILFARCESSKPIISPLGEINHPEDNPSSDEKIALGKALFFDKRMSSDGTVSCATCHVPEMAFTDQKAFSDGVFGHHSQRNSPSLLNAGYLKTTMFDAFVESLEMQVIVPIQDTNEMGMVMKDLLQRLKAIPEYQEAAQRVFQRNFDAFVLTRSIAAFQRSLISDNSRFDQTERKEITRSPKEERGWQLFSKQLYCTKCHPAPHFTTYLAQNNGLYKDYGEDKGRFRIHYDSTEIGFFKIPSLRNIELTYPYMHDGSLKNLDDVLDHYSRGGTANNLQSSDIQSFKLSQQERSDLKTFLFSLTDTSYMIRFRN